MKISVVISVYNEEKKIKACLESAKWADEIVVVDNSSTDNTAEIAKKFTKHVYHQRNDPTNIDLQKNFAIQKATGDWVLILDADEEITPELADEIKNLEASKNVNAYWIPRKNICFGKWIEHTGWYPDHQLRLIRRGKGKFQKKHYHEPIQVEGDTARLKEHLLHYNYETISQFLHKGLEIYAPNEADELIRKGYVFDYHDAIRLPLSEFLSRYFAREGYKDGFHGFMLSILMAFYHFVVFANLWEKNKFVDTGKEDIVNGMEKELRKSKKELIFWVSKKSIEEEKNLLKKVSLKIRKKIHF